MGSRRVKKGVSSTTPLKTPKITNGNHSQQLNFDFLPELRPYGSGFTTRETTPHNRFSDIDDAKLLELEAEGHYVSTPPGSLEELYNDGRYHPYYTGPSRYSSPHNAWDLQLNVLGLQQMSENPYLSPPPSQSIEAVPSTPKKETTTKASPRKVTSPSRRSARISSRRKPA